MLHDLKQRIADDPAVKELLLEAIGSASPQKWEMAVYRYQQDPQHALWGIEENQSLIGCIGIACYSPDELVIRHIAVRAANREHSYGSQLIDLLIQKYESQVIAAETDQEAVGFYRKYGFQIKSLGEKYPGVERFHCLFYV